METAALIFNFQPEQPIVKGDAHDCLLHPGMARDVGQCFLHDPIGRQFLGGGEALAQPQGLEFHANARLGSIAFQMPQECRH